MENNNLYLSKTSLNKVLEVRNSEDLVSTRSVVEQKHSYILKMWQSRVDIEYYSVAYFEHITEFDAL